MLIRDILRRLPKYDKPPKSPFGDPKMVDTAEQTLTLSMDGFIKPRPPMIQFPEAPGKVNAVQIGNRLVIADGVGPLRYVDLATNKVHVYEEPGEKIPVRILTEIKPDTIIENRGGKTYIFCEDNMKELSKKTREVMDIPEHPFPFPELRPYQHEVFKQVQKQKAKSGNLFFDTYRLHQLTRPTHIGVDLAAPGSKDSSVIAYAKRGRNGKMMIWFDEYADFVMPKWYRHPIQWYKLRRAFRAMKDKVKKAGG